MCTTAIFFRKMRSTLWHVSRYVRYVRWKFGPVRTEHDPHGLKLPLVVSITSYPPRFATLFLTLKCLLSQTIRPDIFVLWIAEDDKMALSAEVLALQAKGLTIRYCADLRSYKKIIPTIDAYPNAFIVTADDDIYYPRNWLELLIREYRGDDKEVLCYRAHKIRLGANDEPLKYHEWEWAMRSKEPSPLVFPTGEGGVLYPPGIFDSRVSDAQTFMALCQTADDIWLYWMTRLGGGVSRRVGELMGPQHQQWPGSQGVALCHSNVDGDALNDSCIVNMIAHFGNVMFDRKVLEDPLI